MRISPRIVWTVIQDNELDEVKVKERLHHLWIEMQRANGLCAPSREALTNPEYVEKWMKTYGELPIDEVLRGRCLALVWKCTGGGTWFDVDERIKNTGLSFWRACLRLASLEGR